LCRDVAERRVSSPRAISAVYLLKDEGHVDPEEETTRGSCGTWAEGQKRTAKRYGRWGRTARGPELEAAAQQDSGRGAKAVLNFHTVARKASRQQAERGPDTTASVPRGNDGYGFLTGTGLTTLDGECTLRRLQLRVPEAILDNYSQSIQ